MVDLFRQDPERFSRFSVPFEDILVDYSKNIMTRETLRLLLGLARECKLKEAIERMFTGDQINETERRAVLHVALRNRSNTPIQVNGQRRHARSECGPGADETVFGCDHLRKLEGIYGQGRSPTSSTSGSAGLTWGRSW